MAFSDHLEKIISAIGGFIGILLIIWISQYFIDVKSTVFIVASMGASAVLLFAVPHGPLSQPWPLVGGHLISATIGVTCYQWIPDLFLAASFAVALAIVAMYYLHCIHPPGGATALTAVIGGVEIHALGYSYILMPVLLNTLVILLTAILINILFPWRRYPISLAQRKNQTILPDGSPISTTNLTYALKQMGSFIDISEADLVEIYALATQHTQQHHLIPSQIKINHCYSNGQYGQTWSVRQVFNISPSTNPAQATVTYKVVAGKNRRTVATCSCETFAKWAEAEVFLNENAWQRVVS